MRTVRTPDVRFRSLPDFPWEPRSTDVGDLRVAWVEAGPREGPTVLLMHGEPSWSFLWRKVIPGLVRAGLRAVAPDLPGFGRSDKPGRAEDYSYARLIGWMEAWMDRVGLAGATLVGQDWGSLVGLRMVADRPDRFERIVVANGFLPTGEGSPSAAFRAWRAFARWSPWFPAGRIVDFGCRRSLSPGERAAYEAPFPDRDHRAGARALPRLVPVRPDDPGAEDNRRAWDVLEEWEKPLLTAFSDGDPVTRGLERVFQRRVPGARGRSHVTIRGAGHFLQEDRGEELGRAVADFVLRTG